MFRRPPPTTARAISVAVLQRLLTSNGIGAVVVFSYLAFLAPSGIDTGRNIGLYASTLVAYFAVVVFPVTVAGMRAAAVPQRWLKADRPPTPEEKLAVLRQPWVQTRYSFRAWVGGAIVFTIVNVIQNVAPGDCVRVAVGILLGGLTTSSISFLLIERAHRGVFTLAFADGELPNRRTLGLRGRLVLMWALGSGIPLLGILIGPLGRPVSERADLVTPILALAALGLVTGGLITASAADALADPLDEVRTALDRVGRGELDVSVAVDTGGELGELEAGFNRMAEDLREKERLTDLFGRHVGVEVARRAIEGGVALGGRTRQVSVLFVDIIGSTGFAERNDPDRVIAMLNEFFATVVTTVEQGRGWVNKFDGDGALCAWGALEDDPDHATRALSTARDLRTALQVLRARHPELDAGIGVGSGPVVAGNLGARSRFEYTVIGDAVNEASRLTDLAKGEPMRVLATGAVVRAAAQTERAQWRPCGEMQLRGRAAPTEAWTVVS